YRRPQPSNSTRLLPGDVIHVLERFIRVFSAVWSRLCPYPKPNAEGFVAPSAITVCNGVSPKRFAGTNQRRGSLELLQRQQSQRVPHQYRHSVLAVALTQLFRQPA